MKTKDITLAGLMIALSIIVLYLTTIIPINTFAILTVASAIIPVTIMRSNIKTAVLVYAGTSLIGFFILPINYFLMYIMFFGVYGIVKYFIEKLRKLPLEIGLKYVFFNIIFVLALTVLKGFIGDIQLNVPYWAFILIAEAAFYIYDYALTVLISLYLDKFKNIK